MVATRRSLAKGESEPLLEPESLEIKPELALLNKPTSKPASKSASKPSSKAAAKPTSKPASTRSQRRSSSPSKRSTSPDKSGSRRSSSPAKKVADAQATVQKALKAVGAGDDHEAYEFGGPLGALAIMTFFPLFLYYIYICLIVYDGHLTAPSSLADTPQWLRKMGSYLWLGAFPTPRAIAIYGTFLAFQFSLAWFLPGYKQEGLPIPSLKGRKLVYNCNALGAWYITLATAAFLQFTGLFRLSKLIDHFGEIVTVAQITGFVVAAICYVWAVKSKTAIRMSGNPIYDYFMGAALNPRIGPVDIKMCAEIRIPWILLFLYACAGASKQYEVYGYVSPNQAFMILATGLYVNACAKGEELVPQTWDIAYEKFGWLLAYWNLAGVPFNYCCSIIYMATHDPASYRFHPLAYVLLYSTLLGAYFVWDTSMAQKSRFKAEHAGNYRPRSTFPQLPYGYIPNAKYLQTKKGKLLIDGWWAYLRKPNYVSDTTMAMTWGLCAGFGSLLPYWYPFFFLTMILHRGSRDEARCARKYGKDWEKYCEAVPYKYIYGLY